MGVIGKIVLDLEARTSGWAKGLGDAEKGALRFAKNAGGLLKELSFEKGFNAVGIAKFGGAMKEVTGHAAELATAIRTGASAQEEFGKIVDQIPIVGTFKQAGEAIRELITGEIAADEHARKLGETAERVSDIYREIHESDLTLGFYGDQKAAGEIINNTNRQITAQHVEIEKLEKERDEIEKHKADIMGAGLFSDDNLTKEQHEQLSAINKEIDAHKEKIKDVEEERNQAQKDLKTDAADRQSQYLFTQRQRQEEFDATAHEKALRREGKRTESAIYAIQARAKMEKEQTDFDTREYTLRGLSEDQANERRKSALAKKVAIDRSAADAIAEVNQTEALNSAKLERDNQKKINDIHDDAHIERLKMQDERINAENERTGKSQRSHNAERIQIEKDYQQALYDAGEEYRQRAKTDFVDLTDPQYQAAAKAALEKRQAALGLIDQRATDETRKNELQHAKDLRSAWEEAGTPAEKYHAKLEDINEQYEKLGDKNLRDRQLKKLDADTLKEISDISKDPTAKTNLFGTRLSHTFDRVTGGGGSVAQQQLEEIKKQRANSDQSNRWLLDIWNYVRTLTGANAGAVTELNI